MNKKNKVLAVIWDFDGTIADSRLKNFNVTKRIIEKILGADLKIFPVLNSLNEYHSAHTKVVNWREFYRNSFGMNQVQVDEAGRLWTEYQLKDQTPVSLIKGVGEAIRALSKFPQGIVSQNSKENIIGFLKDQNLLSNFKSIIGYEEVELKSQKPDPKGLLMCIERLTNLKSGDVVYIGDHETDIKCAVNANNILSEGKKVINIISIGAFYGFNVDTTGWRVLADFEIRDINSLPGIIGKLQYN